jgi:hypothetical protein
MAFRDYDGVIRAQKRASARPTRLEDLLLHPVCDDPSASGAECYTDWDRDHVGSARFFVGGILWFMRQTRVNSSTLASYADQAAKVVENQTEWHDIANVRNSDERWRENVARQQFDRAVNRSSQYIQKAATIIVACELCATDMIKSKNTTLKESISKPEDIYKMMSIIPACWNVNDFNQDFMTKVNASGAPHLRTVQHAIGEDSSDVLKDLADGFTVTYPTAKGVFEAVNGELPSEFSVGSVRARPGRRKLGKKRASHNEIVDNG